MQMLLDNQAGATDPTDHGVVWPGGSGMFEAAGDFGGATVSLEFLGCDGVTWIPAGAEATLTASSGAVFELRPGRIRASVAGAAVNVCAAAYRLQD